VSPSPQSRPVHDLALDQIFVKARTYAQWTQAPVAEDLLRGVYELAKLGPTSANCCPGRFAFLLSRAARERLAPHLFSGNRAKTLAAPCCVIFAYDLGFVDHLPHLYPQNPAAASWFSGVGVTAETALRNGTLQAGYFMLAARALGLDCGPMSGFDAAGVDAEFFAGTSWRANFLCNLGYGDPSALRPRSPRLEFEAACQVL
jgi:3-hydroxypropanoate dehydrogenase